MVKIQIDEIAPEDVTDTDVENLSRFVTYLGLLERALELATLIEPHTIPNESGKKL